ncbi:hypothetical protein BKH46_07960 [Helicobacter sp. 12S02634-8]|uniref:hypothetical protein n=1 Tax=Helicobacter sp. 12S02634-8 TaxID=1476199 RepID=UPI000BA5D96D|nr:hypothetical protein [Helicobacter sp. 12S02634-8]PAF46311.1 hypothetical protein BKH46_07960 [Helicobacter sp. 12S02634-8]
MLPRLLILIFLLIAGVLQADDNDTSSNCRVEEQAINPITDINGKVIYMSKKVIKICQKTRKKQTGCKAYSVQTTTYPGTPSYLKNIPEVETNLQAGDSAKGIATMGKAAMAEQTTHIFSGEHSYCDHGTFIDPPNPWMMAIKYGMMLLTGPIVDGIAAGRSAWTAAPGVLSGISEFAKAGVKEATSSFFKQFSLKITENVAKEVVKSIGSKVLADIGREVFKALTNKDESIQQGKNNDNCYIANGACSNPNEDIKSYEEMSGASSEGDAKAANYAQCMVGKFGLSYGTIINYQLGKNLDELSEEDKQSQERLLFSAKTPYPVSGKDIAILMAAFGKEDDGTIKAEDLNTYFYARYGLKEYSTDAAGNKIYALYALSPEDLIIAAETVCGGAETVPYIRSKYGKRFLDPELSNPTVESEMKRQFPVSESAYIPVSDSDQGIKKESLKAQTIKALDSVVSALPMPYNAIGAAILDIANTFNDGNTCTDLEFAEQRPDPKLAITSRRLASGLCVRIPPPAIVLTKDNLPFLDDARISELNAALANRTSEVVKDFMGAQLLRDHYCCYSQKITKIFAEGIMTQLGRTLRDTSCANITLDDLNKISFSPCKDGQSPSKDNCFPQDKFNELKNVVLSGGSIGIDKALDSIIDTTMNLRNKLDH